jgi:crotonobetainyl-CoA:carnitine CoA-transferase CaiB-like acyl-CoA transferase
MASTTTTPKPLRPLKGVRILSLALNLPGPAAMMRLHAMGATCSKLEPPAPAAMPAGTPGDPMGMYNMPAYTTLHQGIRVMQADLKTAKGQTQLHKALARTDVLVTSFRPSALDKLGLGWAGLKKRYPTLSMVAIVGAPGPRAEEPGHDLTYMAEAGLVTGMDTPPSLYADMGGSLMASEAVLQVQMQRMASGKGAHIEVALSEAAHYLALPRNWGLTTAKGSVGGGHAGYRIYPCKDGRVAFAALEPHFALRLMQAAGQTQSDVRSMFRPESHCAIADFVKDKTRTQLDALSVQKDIPLFTLKG